MPDISQFDQEFLTAGSQSAEGEKLAGLVQQNLTPEEQQRLEEIMPVIEEFNMLMYKAQTGEEPPIDEEMGLTNGQGMVEPGPRDGMVPQDIQNQQRVPPRPIEGQMPESAPDQGMQMGGVAAGPVGVVNEQSADGSGVADDVPAKSDGFVINAAAVRHAGLRDINDMIQDAITYAKRQGMKLDFDKTPVDAEKILVSNGEVVIPDVLADIIGYDRLEKINKRGEKETEKVIEEEKQQQQPPPPQKPIQPVMRAAEGGQVKDEEGQVEELLPAEIPQEPYVYKNPETAEFLKEAEGTIAYQTKTGSYDPKTKEFLTYPDSKGKDTIGYGTTENVRKDMRISEKEADMSLDQRIDQEVSALMSDKIPRKFLDNPKTKTAIVSLQYNLGRSGWPKAKEALQKGDIDNFLFYAYDPSPEAANTYLLESEGLLNRRNKEMKLFKEGLQEMGLDN